MSTILDVMAGFNNWFITAANTTHRTRSDLIEREGGYFAQDMIRIAASLKAGPYVSTFYTKAREAFLDSFGEVEDAVAYYPEGYEERATYERLLDFVDAIKSNPVLTAQIRDDYFTR